MLREKLEEIAAGRLSTVDPETILRTALGLAGRLFLAEDIEQLGALFDLLFQASPALAHPADLEMFQTISKEIQGMLTPSFLQSFLPSRSEGASSEGKGRVGFVIGPDLYEKFGPLFVALQRAYRSEARFAVIGEGSPEEIAVYREAIEAQNRELPPDLQIFFRENPHAAAAILRSKRVAELLGLGLTERDARLLREVTYFDLAQSRLQMKAFLESFPGLAALLDKFGAAFTRALESAA